MHSHLEDCKFKEMERMLNHMDKANNKRMDLESPPNLMTTANLLECGINARESH